MSTASATALAATTLDDEARDDLLELHRGTGVIATDIGLGLLLEWSADRLTPENARKKACLSESSLA